MAAKFGCMQDATSITTGPLYVRVVLVSPVDRVDQAEAIHADVDRSMASNHVFRVMFDYRRLGAELDTIRDALWQWAQRTQLEAIGVVVDGELARVRLNMMALSKRVPLRAFVREADAVAWLTDPEQRRPTRELERG